MNDRKPAPPRLPAILVDAARNRGAAFTAEERAELALTGRLPPAVLTLDEQSQRAYTQLASQPDNLARSVFLGGFMTATRRCISRCCRITWLNCCR
jgi:malate dehydrogenase (oxaloacetate-decarboxylating)